MWLYSEGGTSLAMLNAGAALDLTISTVVGSRPDTHRDRTDRRDCRHPGGARSAIRFQCVGQVLIEGAGRLGDDLWIA